MKIEKININQIKNNPDNPRIIKDDKFKKLVKSIKEFPKMLEIRPIVIDDDWMILWWNMRLKACKEAGLTEVYIIRASELTEEQKKEFIIKDNSNFWDWDFELLKENWNEEELNDWWVDVDFSEEEEEESIEEDDFEIEEKNTIIQPWDIIEIWEHRLLCWDSTDLAQVEKLMNWQLADMVFTDPPYNTGMTTKSTNHKSSFLKWFFNDKYTEEEWDLFMEKFLLSYFTFTKDNVALYICLDWRRNHELVPKIKKFFKLSNIIVWDKMIHWLWPDYRYSYELINFCKKWKPKINPSQWEDKEYMDIWHIKRKVWAKDKDHPTVKPLKVVERAIRHASKKWDLVIDFFLWSWSTMSASHLLWRVCYGIEMNPIYCQVIVDRMRKLDPFLIIKRNWEEF